MRIDEFLLARIAEDEKVAREAQRQAGGGPLWVATGMDNAVGVEYDPARILADCAAKRAIVELYQDRLAEAEALAKTNFSPYRAGYVAALHRALRTLLPIYLAGRDPSEPVDLLDTPTST